MKTLKNSLTTLALILAFGAAYSLDTRGVDAGYRDEGHCSICVTEQPNCSPTNTGPQCTCRVGLFSSKDAWVRGNCNIGLFRP